jgi:hypothetical protein
MERADGGAEVERAIRQQLELLRLEEHEIGGRHLVGDRGMIDERSEAEDSPVGQDVTETSASASTR